MSRFPCRPIKTKAVALRRTIRLAWAMPMTGPSGLRWQGSGRETVRLRPLPRLARYPGRPRRTPLLPLHAARRGVHLRPPASPPTRPMHPSRRAPTMGGLRQGWPVVRQWALQRRCMGLGPFGLVAGVGDLQEHVGVAGQVGWAPGSTRRWRRPGRARPRCRGCPTGSGGGRRRRRVVCAALGAAELDTARSHASRLLVVLPTGCRYPFRPPPQAELPGAAPLLGSGTGFADQRRS